MKKPIKTDGDVVRVARQMDTLILKLQDLMMSMRDAEHPNREAIVDRLEDNGIPVLAWATHCVHMELEHPDKWETGCFGIRNMVATKAAETRAK